MHFGSELSTILDLNRGWDSPKHAYSWSTLCKTQFGGVSHWESDYVTLRCCGTRSRKNQPRGLNPRSYSTLPMLGVCRQPTSSSHHSPVIFVSSSTNEAYLIVTAIGIDARPRKPMRAPSPEKPLQEVHCLTLDYDPSKDQANVGRMVWTGRRAGSEG